MASKGKEVDALYDEDLFSDDGEMNFDIGRNSGRDDDDTAALLAAVRSATEMLAAEGLGNMVDIDSMQRQHKSMAGFQQHPQLQELYTDEIEYASDEDESIDDSQEFLGLVAESQKVLSNPDTPLAFPSKTAQRPSRSKRVSYAEDVVDDEMGFIPEGLMEEEESDFTASDGMSSTDDDAHLAEIHELVRESAGFRKKRAPKDGKIGKHANKKESRKPGRPAGRRAVTYSAEVQYLLGEANKWYVDKELSKAFSIFCDIIRIDPNCASAWTTMALIREEEGKHSDALHLYTVAAHLSTSDNTLWERLYSIHISTAAKNESAAMAGDLPAKTAFEEATKQALYCLRFITVNDPQDRGAWQRKLEVLEKRGDFNGMARSYKSILRIDPHHMETIRLASVLFAKHRSDVETPLKWFTEAFAFYNRQAIDLVEQAELQAAGGKAHCKGGGDMSQNDSDEDAMDPDKESDADSDAGELDEEWVEYFMANPTKTVPMEELGGYSYNDLNMAVELRLLRREYKLAIVDIKRGARFIQGRGRESQWEDEEVADEFDTEYKPNDDSSDYNADNLLPIELRTKLGQCRLMLGQEDSAKNHIDVLLAQDAVMYEDLYTEIAESYAEVGHNEIAIEIYQILVGHSETSQPSVWERLARCYRDQGDLQSACDYASAVVEADPSDVDMRLWLGEVYEEMGNFDLAYKMISAVEDIQMAERSREAAETLARQLDAGLDIGNIQGSATTQTSDLNLVQLGRRKASESTERRRQNADEEWRWCLTAMRNAEISFKKLELLKLQVNDQRNRTAIKEYCATAQPLFNDWRHMPSFYLKDRSKPFRTYRKAMMVQLEDDVQAGILDLQGQVSGQAATQRQLNRMKLRLSKKQQDNDNDTRDDETNHSTTFRGQSFERWLDMFLMYGKCLAIDNGSEEALDMLDTVFQSNVFLHNQTSKRIIRLTMLAIAIETNSYDRLYELLRWWCGTRPNKGIVYKIYAFAMAGSAGAASMLTSTNVYKFIRRILDHLQDMYYSRQSITLQTLDSDWQTLADLEDDSHNVVGIAEANKDLTKSDIAALHTLAAHVMLASRTGNTSIVQYTLALSLAPQDASLALYLGVAYLSNTSRREPMKRQENVIRGMAYIQRYAQIKCVEELKATDKWTQGMDKSKKSLDVVVTQEIAYNLARAFHFVGLLDLACAYYNRVFGLPVAVSVFRGDNEQFPELLCDLKREAAYNLASIYVSSGSVLRARQLMVQYCTIN
ncbi:transcription factor TFIIIC subunit tfc4 [Coemansia sp. RSA 988]|nr:transcription factor TFIIIC subunit tfc4 [Coemansia sp. RSA 988]